MTIDIDAARIYGQGWAISDFAALKANQALVAPIMPPKKIGSIEMPGKVRDIRKNEAVAFRVLKVSSALVDEPENGFRVETALPLDAGDVVILRNAMLDPVHPDGEPLAIHRKHILARVTPA